MPQVKQITIYSFDELSPEAKEKACDWYRNASAYDDSNIAFDGAIEDVKNIGLDIQALHQHKTNQGNFLDGAFNCANKILTEHGKDCETYKTAKTFLALREKFIEAEPKDDDGEFTNYSESVAALGEIEAEFLHALLEDYRIIYEKDVEYRGSKEAIEEDIRINEYEFLETGKRA